MFRNSLVCVIFILIVTCMFSCEAPPPCDDANGVQVNLGFYYINGSSLKDTLIDSLVVYTSSDLNTPYYNGLKLKEGSVALPLSMLSDTSVFYFHFGKKKVDTLQFSYTQYTTMVSHECGFINFFNIKEITTSHNKIDSLWVRKDLVEYGDEENVKIYF